MNILGIVAELNPLHTGHDYLIRSLRRQTGADFCVVVMSGDYVQRGEPAFFSKFLRTQAALLSGADLVLELPLSVSTGSAEYFAEGAVSLLERLGCITHLGFGSESGEIRTFRLAGNLLSEEPESYRILLHQFLKTGISFPKARYEALSAFLMICASQDDFSGGGHALSRNAVSSESRVPASDHISEILSLLDTPNNILGAEYCKALHKLRSPMIPVTVKRLGAGYHEEINTIKEHTAPEAGPAAESVTRTGHIPAAEYPSRSDHTPGAGYASASGLRKAFLSSPNPENTKALLQDYIPKSCHLLYLDALRHKQYVTFDDFFLPLYYTLQYTNAEALSRYQDITPEFSGRLLGTFGRCSSVTGLCAALKTKNLTSTRINRCLLHILLQLTKDAVSAEKEQGLCLYARILGFRREAQPLLSLIKKNTSIPLVSKPADARTYLPPLALSQFRQTIKASELYRAMLPGSAPGSEYAQKIIIL